MWEKVWPYADPWDSVRLRTASTHWNVPGKHGPYGELFFLLINKKLYVVSNEVLPVRLSLRKRSKRVRWLDCTCRRQTTKQEQVVVSLRTLETCENMGVQKSPIWSSPCSPSVTSGDDEEYGHNNECRAIEFVGQDWSSEVVAPFLEVWELGRVAVSCHIATDLLCQQLRDACWVSSE